MMTFEEKIKALNAMAQSWYSSAQSDALHAAIMRNRGLGKLADQIAEESKEEFEEAEKVSARILQLGGKVEYGCTEREIYEEPKELLEA